MLTAVEYNPNHNTKASINLSNHSPVSGTINCSQSITDLPNVWWTKLFLNRTKYCLRHTYCPMVINITLKNYLFMTLLIGIKIDSLNIMLFTCSCIFFSTMINLRPQTNTYRS